jgi:hypothetical protein
VHPGGGVLRAIATDDGLVVGTWTLRRGPQGITVRIEPFAPIAPAPARALDAEAADVARFEGTPGASPPAPRPARPPAA